VRIVRWRGWMHIDATIGGGGAKKICATLKCTPQKKKKKFKSKFEYFEVNIIIN